MNYKIPLFDLNFNEEEEFAVLETLRSKWISTGPKAAEFEKLFADMIGVEYAIATSSCTASLHLALKIAGVGANDEVICPSLTFVATVNCISYVNAKPVFCDINSYDDLTIDPVEIEKLITSKTKAIIVMHYGGFSCDMDAIMEIAKKYNLKVIEDACHGPLSEYKGKKLGTIGDIGCFSFFSNKNISTAEGGMIVTNSKEYSERAKLLKSHGMSILSYEKASGHFTDYDVIELGYNYRMDDIRSSIGIVQLKKLEKDLERREELRNYYIKKLCGIEGIIIPFKNYPYFKSNYIFPIVLADSDVSKREDVRNKLKEAGIQTSVHYPAVHLFSLYRDENIKLPKTEYISDNLITLPLYSKLTESEIDFITDYLKKSINKKKPKPKKDKKMTIAVTGSNGFIGKSLVEKLKQLNYKVIPIDRVCNINLLDEDSINSVEKFDCMIHLAARISVKESFMEPVSFFKTNFLLTLNALELCRKYSSKFIYASSYVYGQPNYLPLDEKHPVQGHNPYSQSKIIGENLIRSYHRNYGIPGVIIRAFNVYGPEMNEDFLIPTIIKQSMSGKVVIDDFQPKRDYVYVDDLIDAYISAINFDEPELEEFNIASGVSYSPHDILEIISKQLNKKIDIEELGNIRKNEIYDTIGDYKKAKLYLSWEPKIGIEDGLTRMIGHYYPKK